MRKQNPTWMLYISYCLVVIFLASCGYRPGYGNLSSHVATLSVPYVIGDDDGDLTSAIVQEIVAPSPFEYRTEGGQFLLVVKIVGVNDENIGFRYEQVHGKQFKRSIIPVETRLALTAEVTLVNAATMCSVIPPVNLTASIDFDHEYNATRHDSNVFSLGQLSDFESAFSAATYPLNRILAQKIVEYISAFASEISEEPLSSTR